MKIKGIIKSFCQKGTLNVFKRRRGSQYVLLEKTEKLPIESLKESGYKIPENAVSYTLVTVGKKKDPEFKRQVLTFYDNAFMIRREIHGTNYPKKIRNYTDLWKIENGLSGPFTKKRNITTKQLNPVTKELELKQEEEQFTCTDLSPYNYVYPYGFRRKLHINKNVHDTVNGKKLIRATVTEYPATYNINPMAKKKIISADISLKNDIPEVKQINDETNVTPPMDEFMPYRLLVGEQKEISLAREYLKRKGLDKLKIDVRFSAGEVPKNAEAMFDCDKAAVIFKMVTKGSPAEVAAHEGEHAFQYSLCGRLGKNNSYYGLMCQRELPPVTDLEEMEEGFNYIIAAENYPKTSPDEKLRENSQYWFNELEIGARKKAKQMKKLYENGKDAWHKLFPVTKGSNSF